jgi:hypothetical protein
VFKTDLQNSTKWLPVFEGKNFISYKKDTGVLCNQDALISEAEQPVYHATYSVTDLVLNKTQDVTE